MKTCKYEGDDCLIQNNTDKPIILTEENIKHINTDDIVAWTFASPGAMGRPGEISVITVQENSMCLYRCNYISHSIVREVLTRRFPNVFKCDSEGWKSISMGMGNALYLRENLVSDFECKLQESGQRIYSSHLYLLYQVLVDKNYCEDSGKFGKVAKAVSLFRYNENYFIYEMLDYFLNLPPKCWKYSTKLVIDECNISAEVQTLQYKSNNVEICVEMQMREKKNCYIMQDVTIEYVDTEGGKLTYSSPKNVFYQKGAILYDKLIKLVHERPRYKYSNQMKDMILKDGIKHFIIDGMDSKLMRFERKMENGQCLYKSDYLDGEISMGYDDQSSSENDTYEDAYIRIIIGDYLELKAVHSIDKELYTKITGRRLIRRMQAKDVMIRTSNRNCIEVDHKLVGMTAYVPLYVSNIGLQQVQINVYYCEVCQRYYILESTYNSLKSRGNICCRVIDAKKLVYNKYSNWATEAIIKQYGYNVNANENLSDYKRHVILEFIIQNEIMTKSEVIEHISWLIRSHIDKPKYRDAVEKWSRDYDYLMDGKSIIPPDSIIVEKFWKK